jgi:HEAT repeat protein
VWQFLLDTNRETPIIVAWISLAAVKDLDLEAYLHHVWLKQICKSTEIDTYWQSFQTLLDRQRVWLLFDGADEMGGDGLTKIQTMLKPTWVKSTIRSIITCRLNLWDASSQNVLKNDFQIFRTLDFKPDLVEAFIGKWFDDDAVAGKKLIVALDETGKERIKDLARNPLRLTLLCNIWRRGESLPDTQAGLYYKFVNYFYNWSKFPELAKLRGELDRLMGELAKYGINKPMLRFRFTETELRNQLIDPEHIEALKTLGWLNCVGVDERDDEVYAFFHPTFQEYFAACAIDDWDYFLPMAHIDRPILGESGENLYRVFEQEWRQPMLLWFGREDVKIELKEKFIEKLMNFREQEGKFYYYRAYCMAAIAIGEFKSSTYIEEIVQRILRWAHGYFNTEKQEWMIFLDHIQSLAREIIPFTHRGCAINTLIQSLKQLNVDDNTLSGCKMVSLLGRIDTGSVNAINILLQLLQKSDVNDDLRYTVACVLGRIGKGNIEATNVLLQFLKQSDVDNEILCDVAAALGWLEEGNKEAINALLQLLQQPDLSEDLRTQVNIRLSDIAVGNREAIDMLLQLLQQPDLPDEFLFSVGSILSDIAVGNKKAINALIQLLRQPDLPNEFLATVEIILSDIAVGNKKAINTLIQLLQQSDLPNEFLFSVGSILSNIAIGNKEAIHTLIQLLQQPDLSNELRAVITYILSCIDGGNKKAVDTLIEILHQPELSDELCASITTILGQTVEGNKEVINNLIKFLQQPDLSDELCDKLTSILYDISAKNKGAIYHLTKQKSVSFDQSIDNLIEFLQQTDLSNEIRSGIASLLHDIVVGDKKEIDTRCKLLQQMDLSDEISYVVTIILFDIDVGNKKEIDNLIKLLQKSELSDKLRYKVTCSLGYWIERGNKEVIDTLLQIIQQLELSDEFFFQVPFALQKILTKQTMSSTIWQLKKYTTDEVYQSNFKKFELCDKVIFHCAKTLSYQEFHSAWHQFCLPVSPFSS